MDREGFRALSNACRDGARWNVVVSYRSRAGIVDVQHNIMELEDLQELVEFGPDFHSIERITITYDSEGRAPTFVDDEVVPL